MPLALCDRDTQCHYISTNMICTSVGGGSDKCYCSDSSLRDGENGLCRQVSGLHTIRASYSAGMSAWLDGSEWFIHYKCQLASIGVWRGVSGSLPHGPVTQ